MRMGGTPAHTDQWALHPAPQLVLHAGDKGPGTLRAAHELLGLGRDMGGGVPAGLEKMAPTPPWIHPASLTT